jgi:arsenate reductase
VRTRYRITQFARLAGIAPSAVRWYETAGVLPAARREANGYRTYGEDDLDRLRLIVALRRLGIHTDAAARLAASLRGEGIASAGASSEIASVLATHLEEVRRQRRSLDQVEAELLDLQMTVSAVTRDPRRTSVPSDRPIRVLFVCTHNSARSQIAEAMLARLGGPAFDVHSAGTEVTRVNPLAIRALGEQGIDWSGARSKAISEFLDQQFDYVITVCDRARETCPVFPGSLNSLHWGLDDPSEVEGSDDERLAAFRRTLVEIVARLRPFIEIARRASGHGVDPMAGGR